MLLARTAPRPEDPAARVEGISLFLVDLRAGRPAGDPRRAAGPDDVQLRHQPGLVQEMRIPADSLLGEEGKGFRYVIDGWNAERILAASEAIGDGYWFLDRGAAYAGERVVFGRAARAWSRNTIA